MPAPVPIEFAAGLGPLAELAVQAGAAKSRREDRVRQQTNDLSFLRDEMSRRQRQNEVEAQFRLQQSEQFARQDAASKQSFQLQQAGQQLRGGTIGPRNRRPTISRPGSLQQAAASTGQSMVDLTPSAGTASISTRRGTFTTQPDGSIVRESPTHGQELVDPLTGELNTSLLPDEARDPGALVKDRALAGGTGFVGAGKGKRDIVLLSTAQQLQMLSSATSLPPSDRTILEQAIRSGGLDTQQLLNEIQQRQPKADDERKIDGLSIRDRQLEIQRLRRRKLSFSEFNDPEGTQRNTIDAAIAAEEENVKRQQYIKDAPQLSGKSLANPNPSDEGNVLTESNARRFFEQAGGDRDLARSLARDAGFNIPQQ